MAEAMKNLVEKCLDEGSATEGEKANELTVEERNLLSVAYKNAVGARRASWRIISSVEQKEANRNHMANKNLAAEYRQKVEDELNKICQEILALLTNKLLPRTSVGVTPAPPAAQRQVEEGSDESPRFFSPLAGL